MDSDEEDMSFDEDPNHDSSSNELEDNDFVPSGSRKKEQEGDGDGNVDDIVEDEASQDQISPFKAAGKERTASTSSTGVAVDYVFLSPEQICQYMNQVIREVQQVIQLPPTTTRILLSHFQWDKEILMEQYYEDPDKLFNAASVISPENMAKPSRALSSSQGTCDICLTSLKGVELKGTDCGHRFCSTCWRAYLVTKIMDENSSCRIECPAFKCNMLIGNDDFVMEMIAGPGQGAVKRKYQHGITNSFVEAHKCMRWCPGVDCLYAVRVSSPDWVRVECTHCHITFCFLCGEPWHDPVTCEILRKWKKKCADDSETSNWISANTKECPQCHATIEKDGGCNHIVCKNTVCKAEFCWICLGPWQPHGSSWFKCNRYSDNDAKSARDAQERSRAALQRYLFYFNRFMNHQQSLQLESKLKSSIRIKMEEMQQHNMSWIEVQFLQKAVDTLQNCRQTLLYTYVFAFYLGKSNQQIIFEDNQHDLELSTEKLSGYLEREITGQNVADIKQKVQDKACYCEMRRRVLIQHVHEGYDKEWWQFHGDK